MKKLIMFVLLVVGVFGLTGCQNASGLLNSKYLIVSTSPDYAPYEFIDPNQTGIDKYVGADVELMKYIANELGVVLKIEEMAFEACLTAVQTRKVDISISGFSWTPKRAENYALSNSYFGEGDGLQQILILNSNADKYSSLSDLDSPEVKVGAQAGSLQEELVDSQLPNATKELITDLDMAVSLLVSGTIDALAISEYAAEVRLNSNQSLALLNEDFDIPAVGSVIIAKKGNEALIDQINMIIANVVEQGLYAVWMEEATALANQLGEDVG